MPSTPSREMIARAGRMLAASASALTLSRANANAKGPAGRSASAYRSASWGSAATMSTSSDAMQAWRHRITNTRLTNHSRVRGRDCERLRRFNAEIAAEIAEHAEKSWDFFSAVFAVSAFNVIGSHAG